MIISRIIAPKSTPMINCMRGDMFDMKEVAFVETSSAKFDGSEGIIRETKGGNLPYMLTSVS